MFFNYKEILKKPSDIMVENMDCMENHKETDVRLRSGWQSDPNTRGSSYVGPVIPDNQGTSWIINSPDGKCTGYSLNLLVELHQSS